MASTSKKPRKVITTLSITLEAQNCIFDNGYASPRTQGEFISQLILDYHARRTRELTHAELIAEIRRLVDLLERTPIDNG